MDEQHYDDYYQYIIIKSYVIKMNETKTSKTKTILTWSPLQLHVPRTASVTILCSGFIIVQASSVADLIQNLYHIHYFLLLTHCHCSD